MNYVPPRRSDGSNQHRRVVQPWPANRPFRILSIDGGGICGILPASVLAEIEIRFLDGESVAKHFDMIAGTSTGGIIALGLAHGLKAQDIQKFYVERGDRVFPRSNLIGRALARLRRLHKPLYSNAPLEEEMLRIFGC